jgi:hypothetical protein
MTELNGLQLELLASSVAGIYKHLGGVVQYHSGRRQRTLKEAKLTRPLNVLARLHWVLLNNKDRHSVPSLPNNKGYLPTI